MMLWTVVLTAASLMCCTAAQDNLTCVENPTGEVSLNVAVRGVPGPEGPQGSTGEVGPRGVKGERGLTGLRGLKGDRGDIGGVGKTGPKGEIGTKGQKGSRGIQGIPGPVGSPGLAGARGSRGYSGVEGPTGPSGQPGLPGPRGPQGEDGDTVLSEEEFQAVSNRLKDSLVAAISTDDEKQRNRLDDMKDNLTELIQDQQAVIDDIQEQLKNISESHYKLLQLQNITVKCGELGDWRRVSYFDTTLGHSCPSQWRTVTNTTTGQKACGRTGTSRGCTSLKLSTDGEYSKVCGFIRGYQRGATQGFVPYSHHGQKSIDSTYAAGVLLSQGSPRQHLWSYIAALSESVYAAYYRCPCATKSFQSSWIPSFVGNHYFCESGFSARYQYITAWEDPLWDGKGCTVRGSLCCTCTNCGWFHRQVQPSSDSIEVRICGNYLNYSHSDVPINQMEIWVM